MMSQENSRNIKLGAFVLAGTLLLVTALYLIGTKQNLFGSTFRLRARFSNVNGLTQGNNVRFAGIDVGTVKAVTIENDSTVVVDLLLKKEVQQFIRKNSLASVGTDGLMGNRLVNITSLPYPAVQVSDGDMLNSLKPLEMDEMMRTLDVTNQNIRVVTHNLRVITDNITNRNSFWQILSDTGLAKDVKNAVVDFSRASHNTNAMTADARFITSKIRNGEGIGALVNDTLLPRRLRDISRDIAIVSDSAKRITKRLSTLMYDVDQGKGSLGMLLRDSTTVLNLNRSLQSLDSSAVNFNENMEALQHTWPLKKYFRKTAGKK